MICSSSGSWATRRPTRTCGERRVRKRRAGAVAIVVLGHEGCGAVKAAIDVAQNGTQLPGDIGAFVAPIVPIAQQLIPTTPKDDLVQAVTLANIRQGVMTLQQNAPLADSIAAGKLRVVGGEYQLRSGKVLTV